MPLIRTEVERVCVMINHLLMNKHYSLCTKINALKFLRLLQSGYWYRLKRTWRLSNFEQKQIAENSIWNSSGLEDIFPLPKSQVSPRITLADDFCNDQIGTLAFGLQTRFTSSWETPGNSWETSFPIHCLMADNYICVYKATNQTKVC